MVIFYKYFLSSLFAHLWCLPWCPTFGCRWTVGASWGAIVPRTMGPSVSHPWISIRILAWSSIVFTFAFLRLHLRVRFWLAHEWAFVHPRTSCLYLHVSDVFHGVLLLGTGGQLGHPEVQQWVYPFPILGSLFAYSTWSSIVFTSAFLRLCLRVRFWLAHKRASVHPRTFLLYLHVSDVFHGVLLLGASG